MDIGGVGAATIIGGPHKGAGVRVASRNLPASQNTCLQNSKSVKVQNSKLKKLYIPKRLQSSKPGCGGVERDTPKYPIVL